MVLDRKGNYLLANCNDRTIQMYKIVPLQRPPTSRRETFTLPNAKSRIVTMKVGIICTDGLGC